MDYEGSHSHHPQTGSYSLNQQQVVLDPFSIVKQALDGQIDAQDAAATLAGAAVLLQITASVKNAPADIRVEKLLQASKAFDQVLSGEDRYVPEAEEKRRHRSEVNRINALKRWHPEEELTPEEIDRKIRFQERTRTAARARWDRVKQEGEQ